MYTLFHVVVPLYEWFYLLFGGSGYWVLDLTGLSILSTEYPDYEFISIYCSIVLYKFWPTIPLLSIILAVSGTFLFVL